MIRYILPLSLILVLPSCMLSTVGEAVDISRRQSKQVAKGTSFQGQGFSVKAPEERLYPVMNQPTRGAVAFRPTDTFRDGLAYMVTPFPMESTATTRQALATWNQNYMRKQPKVLEQKDTKFKGYPATEAVVEVPEGGGSQIAAFLVVKTPKGFFLLTRGDFHRPSVDRSLVISQCKTGLKWLKESTSF